MKKINSNNINYTDNIYYICRTILIIGLPLTIISALVLSLPHSSAIFSGASSDSLTLSLPSSCTLGSVVNTAHNAILISGTYTQDIGKTTITTLCNDGNGYAIYANGFSNSTAGNNVLISNISNGHNISTGLATSGDTSNWAMKLNNVANDSSSTPPTIEAPYNNTYGLVPSTWTKVAGKQSGTTDMITGSSFTTTYAVYTAPTQHSGTYTGQVAYALIHAYEDDLVPNIRYMQDVAEWKDELVVDQAVIAIDKRDFKQYYVAKLRDGNVWMTQNLDFDIATYINEQGQEVMKPLTSEDTDLTDHSLTEPYANGYTYNAGTGITTWIPAASAKTINFDSAPVDNWQSSSVYPSSANKDGSNTENLALGNYYNWTIAIASNNSKTLTNSTLNNVASNPQNSICPKGWRLPTISNQSGNTANSTNEFSRLNTLYNNGLTTDPANLINAPLHFVISGFIYGSNSFSSGEGIYWSSTNSSSSDSYFFSIANNRIKTDKWGKGNGWSIRCLAR